jgi:hypothetical protein
MAQRMYREDSSLVHLRISQHDKSNKACTNDPAEHLYLHGAVVAAVVAVVVSLPGSIQAGRLSNNTLISGLLLHSLIITKLPICIQLHTLSHKHEAALLGRTQGGRQEQKV